MSVNQLILDDRAVWFTLAGVELGPDEDMQWCFERCNHIKTLLLEQDSIGSLAPVVKACFKVCQVDRVAIDTSYGPQLVLGVQLVSADDFFWAQAQIANQLKRVLPSSTLVTGFICHPYKNIVDAYENF